MPLDFEFESFIIAYRTCVEVIVKLIAFKVTHSDPREKNNFNFQKTLKIVLLGKTK